MHLAVHKHNPTYLSFSSKETVATLWRWGIVSVLLLMTFTLRVWNLSGPSLWYDEAYHWWAVSQPFDEMLGLSVRETVPPTHYLALRAWIFLAGTSEFAMRFLSVLYGFLTVAAMARMARRLTGSHTAQVWVLFLGALWTPLIWVSREARMYGGFVAWSVFADMALIETLYTREARTRRRWAWIWGGMLLGTLASLTLSAFWLVGQGLFVLVVLLRRPRHTARDVLRDVIPPTVIAGLSFLPWVVSALRVVGTNASYWAGHLPVVEFVRIALAGMTVFDYLPPAWKVTAGGLILLATLPPLLFARHRPIAGLYPLLQLIPLGVMALIFSNLPKWCSRHATFFAPLPALSLAIGWGMAAQWSSRTARRLAYVFLTACSVIVVAFTFRADLNLLASPAYAVEDWRSAARYVEEHRAPGDVVIVETGSVFPSWIYYAGTDRVLALPDDQLLNVSHVLDYADTAQALNMALRDATGVWLVTWLDHITDPTGIVPALLSDLGPETPVPAFHGLGLRHFELERRADFPAQPPLTAQPVQPTLPDLTLWGYRVPGTPQPAGAPLDVWTFWTVDAPDLHRDRFYQVVLRLLDARGDEWARTDSTPGSGDYRPDRWPATTPVLGRYALISNPWTPPGVYTPTLTVYFVGGASADESSATVVLQPVTLTPAVVSPNLPERASPVEPTHLPVPLHLLGLWIGQETVLPCSQLEGWAYWESAVAWPTGPSNDDLTVVFGLQEHTLVLPVVPEPAHQSWPAGTRFATQFRLPIGCRTLGAQAPLTVQLKAMENKDSIADWYGPMIRIIAERAFELPTDLLPASVDFGPGFAELAGYALTPELKAGQPFSLTLYWRAGATADTPYSVFVHVTQPDIPSPLAAQHDGWPALGTKPTHTWTPGEIIADVHPLPGLPAGTYRLHIGLYDAAGRLPCYEGGAALPDNAVTIPLTVAP